jgi:hypothetical protein
MATPLQGFIDGRQVSFIAGETIAPYQRVYLSAANTVKLAGTGNYSIGSALGNAATGEPVSIALDGPGNQLGITSGTVTVGDNVYQAASGAITSNRLISGIKLGIALQTSTTGLPVAFSVAKSPNPFVTFTVAAANTLVEGSRVALGTTSGQVVLCPITSPGIGSSTGAFAAGETATIRLDLASEIQFGLTGEATDAGDAIYSGAAGVVTDTAAATSYLIGQAPAAAANGAIVAFIPTRGQAVP